MRKLIGFCALQTLCLAAIGQQASLSDNPSSAAEDSITSRYLSSRGELLPVYNGRQFSGGYSGIKGSAFYGGSDWTVGSVCFENVWYPQIPIMYDAYRDELLIKHPSGIPLVLYSDRVQAFEYGGYRFVRLYATQAGVPRTGFYEVLEKGKLTIYAYRFCLLEERIVDQKIEREFLAKGRYYAGWQKQFFQVSRQKQLSSIVKEDRQQIQQALKQAGIKYNKKPEAALKIIAHTYNQSNP